MDRDTVIPTVDCAGADELLDALNRRHHAWKGAPMNWVFRGQSDATWNLIPTALRAAGGAGFRGDFEVMDAVRRELMAVTDFANGAEAESLPIPGEAEVFLRYLTGVDRARSGKPGDKPHNDILGTELGRMEWPQAELWETLALAQQHGMPTRLLDWSYRPLVAAYFAAKGAARRVRGGGAADGRLAVFALRRNLVDFHWFDGGHVQFVHGKRSSNRRLAAQDGLFTVVRNVPESRQPELLALDNLVADRLSPWDDYSDPLGPHLRRFTMPMAEAPRLLRLLHFEYVNAATVRPSYGGVIEALKERALWDQ